MNWAAPATYIMVALVLGIAFLLGRGMFREFRTAYRKDEEEKTNKYIKGKMGEYAIVLALIVISALKAGPLSALGEKLYGKPAPTIDSPFHGLGK
jgi:hypothetical protein